MGNVTKGVDVSTVGLPLAKSHFIEIDDNNMTRASCDKGTANFDYDYGYASFAVPVNEKEWEVVINYCNGTQKTIIFDNGEIKVEEVSP